MNSVTRNGVFETNSSSSHSISIAAGSSTGVLTDNGLEVDENGVCHVSLGGYSGDGEHHTDPLTKASYCATYINEFDPGLRRLELEKRFRDVIMAATGAKTVKIIGEGWIDHQSVGVAGKAFESDETLRNFIFNPDSELVLDYNG